MQHTSDPHVQQLSANYGIDIMITVIAEYAAHSFVFTL